MNYPPEFCQKLGIIYRYSQFFVNNAKIEKHLEYFTEELIIQ